MAEHCHESSIATSFSAANWWPDVHATSLSSWTTGGAFTNNQPLCNNNVRPQDQNPNSNCSGEDDVSISTSFATNASNHSGFSIESSRRLVENASTNDVHGEAVSDNHHLWSQVLLSVGTTGELQNLSTGMFGPACDYLKKIDDGWEFSGATNSTNFQKNFNGFNGGQYQSKNLTSVRNWSIAPPEIEINQQFDQYSPKMAAIKNENRESDVGGDRFFRRGLSGSPGIGYQVGIDHEAVVGDNSKYYCNSMTDFECANRRAFGDMVTLDSCSRKPGLDFNMSNKPMLKTLKSSDRRKQCLQTSHQLRPMVTKFNTVAIDNGRGNGVANEGKRKKSEDASATLSKKPKNETSLISSAKIQVPKAKLGDKITALQQIVSPFGKTDTASVLWEAIGYIKCLQEQVQLLSNPYLKTNVMKMSQAPHCEPWRGLDRKDRGDTKLDLKSRGLCLVPVSCTPQVYHGNTGSDYWTPTYRGCFYR